MSLVRTSTEIAQLCRGRLQGITDLAVTGVAALAEAQPADVSFLGNDKYASQVLPSRAGVVLVPENFPEPVPAGRAWVFCADPSAAFNQIVELFAPPPIAFAPGRHPRACVDDTAVVPASVHVGACAVIEAGAVIGDGAVIGAGTYVGHDVRIGAGCLIYPNVSIRERCVLGNKVIVHCGTVIGADGFGYIPNPSGHIKVPQVGIVPIDDDVEIGANVTIDRARFGRTWIKRGVKIDNLVQVAHNVVIGELSFIIAQVGISGSSRIGRGCVLWGQAGMAGHLELGDGAQAMAQSGIAKSVPPGGRVVGSPAVPEREFVRDLFNVHRVDKLAAQIKLLQRELAELKAR